MKDFFKSLPGILTSIATFLTAITTLYITFFAGTETNPDKNGNPSVVDIVEDTATADTITSEIRLPAPQPIHPECNSAQKWPDNRSYFIVRWTPVENAASYIIEFDCRDSKQAIGGWHGSDEKPWKIVEGVASRVPDNPIYSSTIYQNIKREGANTLRWRVWAVDHNDIEGNKSQWCQIMFF